MYYQHFGLSGPPFASGALPAPLYLSAGHREGLAALQWGLREPSGFTMLVGEIGTGKTTLIHSLLEEHHEGVRIVSVSNPKLSFEEMLRVIAGQLATTPAGTGKLELIQALDSSVAAQPEQIALILDEAQDISDETLEELRLLSNSQTAGQRRLQMVLVGQLELARRLARPELRQLNQRIGARALLPTLRPAEVRDYVEYRLRAYHGDIRKLFKRGALRELAHSSAGIPRRINVLCHNALILAYAQRAARVGAAHMREAARDYDNLLTGAAASASSAAQFAQHGRGLLFKTAVVSALGVAALGASYFLAPRALSTIYPAPVSRAAMPAANAEVTGTAQAAGKMASAVQCNVRPAADQAALDAATVGARDSAGSSQTAAPQSAAKVQSESSAPAPTIGAEAGKTAAANSARAENPAASTSARAKPHPPALNSSPARPAEAVVVRPGDTLSKIALRRNGSAGTDGVRRQIAELVKANPQIEDANHIYPGQIIHLQEASR